MNMLIEKAALAAAEKLPGRVRYWAAVLVQGSYVEAHSPSAGAEVTVNDMLAWADSPEADLGGKGALLTFFRAVQKLAADNLELKNELAMVKSEYAALYWDVRAAPDRDGIDTLATHPRPQDS